MQPDGGYGLGVGEVDHVYVLATGGNIVFDGTPEQVFANAERLRESNIDPPVLAELFARLAERDPSAPTPALSVDAAAEALLRWRGVDGVGTRENMGSD